MHPTIKNGPVAIYARFSSDRQRETSIEDQVRRCRDYIAQSGGDPEKAQVFSDFAISGAGLDRPGFEAMMNAIESQRVQVIVTEDLSRISRDFTDAAIIFRKLQFAQIPLIGVADGIDTSSKNAKLSFTVKSLVADLYLDDLRDKTLRGLEGRALAGYATGNTPYGYRTIAEVDEYGNTRGHRIEIDPDQAAILRRIFTEYVEGGSLLGIAKGLNQDGIPSPRARTRHKTKRWGRSSIRAILYNEKYSGLWKYKQRQWVKVPGTNRRVPRDRDASEVISSERPELRIIDHDLWEATRKRLASMKRKYTKKRSKERVISNGKSNYLLSGILVCGQCDSPMVVHSGGKTKYYHCSGNRNKGICDNSRLVREKLIRTKLLAGIREQLSSQEGIAYVRKRVAEELGEFSRRIAAELKERRARLGRTEDKIRSLIEFLAQGERSDYITTALRDLEAHARAEKIEIDRLDRDSREPLRLPSLDEVATLVFDLEARFAQDPVAGRNQLRSWLKDELIRITPQADGSWIAEGAIYPLVILCDSKKSLPTKGPEKAKGHGGGSQVADSSWPNIRSGGTDRMINYLILLLFSATSWL